MLPSKLSLVSLCNQSMTKMLLVIVTEPKALRVGWPLDLVVSWRAMWPLSQGYITSVHYYVSDSSYNILDQHITCYTLYSALAAGRVSKCVYRPLCLYCVDWWQELSLHLLEPRGPLHVTFDLWPYLTPSHPPRKWPYSDLPASAWEWIGRLKMGVVRTSERTTEAAVGVLL